MGLTFPVVSRFRDVQDVTWTQHLVEGEVDGGSGGRELRAGGGVDLHEHVDSVAERDEDEDVDVDEPGEVLDENGLEDVCQGVPILEAFDVVDGVQPACNQKDRQKLKVQLQLQRIDARNVPRHTGDGEGEGRYV